jgi:ERCC4-related helicase
MLGLDVGEVDLIINLDTPKSLIRSVQRAGRTGRYKETLFTLKYETHFF